MEEVYKELAVAVVKRCIIDSLWSREILEKGEPQKADFEKQIQYYRKHREYLQAQRMWFDTNAFMESETWSMYTDIDVKTLKNKLKGLSYNEVRKSLQNEEENN